MTKWERVLVALVVMLMVVFGVWLVLEWRAEDRAWDRETVPGAVLHDHMGFVHADTADPGDSGEVVWTVDSAAGAEFDHMERTIGIDRAPFSLTIRFMWGHQGAVQYRAVNGKLVLNMILRPVYHSRAAATAIAAHEMGHTYAIWYASDYSEETAWTLAACYGSDQSRAWIAEVVGVEPVASECETAKTALGAH